MIPRRAVPPCRVLAAVLWICAGCVRPDRTPPDTVVIAVNSNPRSLDPRFATDALASKLVELTCPGLIGRDEAGNLRPELSESWTWESPLRLSFALRPGVLFSDGVALEAADVVATYESIRSPGTASVFAAAYGEIDRIEARDAATVVFHLKEPSAPLLQDLVNPGVVRRRSLVKETEDELPVCAGAFVPVSFRRDDAVELIANPRYWRGAPKIARLSVRIVPDATIRVLEAAHGSVDLIQNDFPPHFLRVLEKQKDLVIEKKPGRNLKYLVFNLAKPALGDVRVRRALAMAIDRDAILRYKLAGLGRPATGVLSPEDPFYEPDVESYAFDPAAAERLLDEAGFPRGAEGVRMHFEYKTSTDETAVGVAKVLKSNWAAIGVDVTIRPAEWGIFFHDVQTGNFEMYSLTMTAVVDPDLQRWLLHSANIPPGGQISNRGGYRNPALDALLDQGSAEIDPVKRKVLYSEVQRIVARELPVVPLWYESVVAARNRRLEGYELSPYAAFVGLARAEKKEP